MCLREPLRGGFKGFRFGTLLPRLRILMHNRGRQLKPVGPDKRESAGATEPRREPDELDDLRRSRYFFLLAFFLAAGFLAAFFLAAMMVYLLHVFRTR